MSTPWISILFYVIASLLGAVGQYLFKSGADQVRGGPLAALANGRILTGLLCYIAILVLQLSAFKRGGSLTVLYPIYACTFIWAAFLAWIAFGTEIRPINVLGMLLLIGGMFCMGHQPPHAPGATIAPSTQNVR